MKKLFSLLPLLLLAVFALTQNVFYTESFGDIVNPDRGFYHPISVEASNFVPLSASDMQDLRETPFMPWNGDYFVRTSLVYRQYILDAFVNTDVIAPSFLNNMETDFDAARTAGVRLIVRFCYTSTPDTTCGAAACPPYGDAPKSRILSHISYLKPYLQANEDVIAIVQSGLIGVWGEQYYTDHFGDASVQGKLTNQNWQDRNEILTALLDAVPASRMIQLRYPQMKQKYIYGVDAPVTAAAMTIAQAYDGSAISRLAFHNDCFLSSSNDTGTYLDYGDDNTPSSDQTDVLKPYAIADGAFVGVGGETCSDGFSPQNDCGGQTVTDMDGLNYSFLNADYNNAVNNDWQDGGCMDEIKRRMGYCFVMRNGSFPASAASGDLVSFTLNLDNVGFAAPFNERILQFVLRSTSGNGDYKVTVNGSNTDTRFWFPGAISLAGNIVIPNEVPAGSYECHLQVMDPSNNYALANRPEYSIQFANTGAWDAVSGFNNLNHTISISSMAPEPPFCLSVDGNPAEWSWVNSISTTGTGGLNSLKVADNESTILLLVENMIDANYQVFLDTDNDATGGNEFVGTVWSSTGFNFMIENGNLYAYTGTGFDWSWAFVATVNDFKNSTLVELEISKPDLGSLGSAINVGMASLNSSWTDVGLIPSGSSAAGYVLGSTNGICNCSVDNLQLSGNMFSSGNVGTDGTIESSQQIFGPVTVLYNSGVSILLEAGFEVGTNAAFEAVIGGCSQ